MNIKAAKTSFLKNFQPARGVFLSVLVLVCAVIFLTNFPFGKWLTGWDNLHPELNVWLNVKRSFTAVWVENQGAGHLGGHGHAANLLHSLSIGFLSLFFPQESLRAIFTFLMLFSGGFGVFFLAEYYLGLKEKNKTLIYASGFLTSLLYLLNFSMVANFYVQLESFIIFYGVLPWTLITLFHYFDVPNKKNLTRFGILSVLLSATGFIPPLFVAYGIVVGFLMLFYWLSKRNVQSAKTIAAAVAVIFVTNAYWLLPTAYFTATTSSVYLKSQNNQLSTQDFNLQSISYGGFMDVVLLRGFMIASIDSPIQVGQPSFYIMQQWLDHSNSFKVKNIGLLFFAIALIGIVAGSRKRGSYQHFTMAAVYLFMFAALAQRVFPFSAFDELLKAIPVINQAFRAGYTKLSVPLALAFCILFGQGMLYLLRLSAKLYQQVAIYPIVVVFTGLIIFFGLPTFQGQLFYKREKVNIPQEYLQLFEFFDHQPTSQRIAHLPVHWNWGWNIYNWGYSGSGFLWYGIEQPIIDRSFDVWSSANESFYHELSTTIYSIGDQPTEEDSLRVYNVFKKYRVTWIVLDQNLILPGFDSKVMKLEETKSLLSSSHVKLVKEFNNILVYQVQDSPLSFITAPSSFASTTPVVPYDRVDTRYQSGDYFEGDATEVPFADVTQARQLSGVSFSNDMMTITRQITKTGELLIPSFYASNTRVPVIVSSENAGQKLKVTLKTILPTFTVANQVIDQNSQQSIELTYPKGSNPVGLQVGNKAFELSADNSKLGTIFLDLSQPVQVKVYTDKDQEELPLADVFRFQPVRTCWMRPDQKVIVEKDPIEDGFTLRAQNASACVNYRLGQLDAGDNKSFIVDFESRSSNGGKPDLCINKEGDDTRCLNEDIYTSTVSSNDWVSFHAVVPIEEDGTYWINLLGRTSDLTSEKRETSYRNLKVRMVSGGPTATISAKDWPKSNTASALQVKAPTEIKVQMPTSLGSQWLPQTDTGPVGNCEFQHAGSVQQIVNGQSITLSATNNGVACKNAPFPNLPLDQEYILHLKGQHITGRGFKFYVLNQSTHRQDLEYLLPTKDFDVSYSLLSWPDGKNSGYSVGLESRSYGPISTSNRLDQLNIVPLPLSLLKEIKVTTPNTEVQMSNQVTIKKVQKFGTFLYIVDVQNDKPGVFELSQGYHKGWLAFQANKPSFLKHIIVNGWANGWKIDAGNHVVVIIFWPQLLGTFGMLCLAGAFLFAIFKHGMKRKFKSFAEVKKYISTVLVGYMR